ncbi:class I SAM-dependent methyltransferase [Kovacikia minuta CCNUW1]|uniref:class I SAM-dependent methyltransferase n=1 Tax=Kovacikia minuta TaxID=2931930 RepID=UPI001CCDAE36|nr:class I SAM-dependent methyltransferase [Kovacikia minuta]UBF24394.1 class I SAM-dependent methyltransferase [Kovacikia minuta CCNUW1]
MATTASTPNLVSQLVNGILRIKPLANLAKHQARQMMVKRAESIGVYWTKEVEALKTHDWETDLAQVKDPDLKYPEYYVTSFHAYEEGNLGWNPALEVEVAARAVHAHIWKDAGAQGDARLRQSYHAVLTAMLPQPPRDIVDLGCGAGMSTFALQATYPEATVTGVDLSPYFLAVANYRSGIRGQKNDTETRGREDAERKAEGRGQRAEGKKDTGTRGHGGAENSLIQNSKLKTQNSKLFTTPHTPHPTPPHWLHAPAEATGLPAASFDLVSACLVFHELPQSAAVAIFQEARRLLRPGGIWR